MKKEINKYHKESTLKCISPRHKRKKEKHSRLEKSNREKATNLEYIKAIRKQDSLKRKWNESLEKLQENFDNINELSNLIRQQNKKATFTNFKLNFNAQLDEDKDLQTEFTDIVTELKDHVGGKTKNSYVNKLPSNKFGSITEGITRIQTFYEPHSKLKKLINAHATKMKISKFKTASKSNIREAQKAPKRKITSPLKGRLKESVVVVNNLLNKEFRHFSPIAPRLTRKQEAFLKFYHRIDQEFRNQDVKDVLFKWCTNTRINRNNHREFKSLDTPREVEVVEKTLRSLRKVSLYLKVIFEH